MLNVPVLSSIAFAAQITNLLFSRGAILVYIFLLIGIIATVVIYVMISENKKESRVEPHFYMEGHSSS